MIALTLGGLAALATFAGGVWLGWAIAGRPSRHAATADLLVLGWVGWFVQGSIVLGLGWLGLIGPGVLAAVVLLPLGAAALDRRFRGWVPTAMADYRQDLRGPGWAWCLAGTAWGWLALQLLAPPFHYDLVTYSFGQPMHWLTAGSIGPVGPDQYAYEAVPARMHFLLSLGLVGSSGVALSLLLWVVAAALLTARLVKTCTRRASVWPLLAIVAFSITPAVWDLLLLRKDDVSAAWGGAALLFMTLSLRREPKPSVWSWLVLGCAGAATVVAKPGVTAAFVAACCLWAGWRPAADWRPRALAWCATAGAGVVALLPMVIHAWLGLGHPLAAALPYWSRYPLASTRWFVAMGDAFPWQPQPLERFLPYAFMELSRFYDPSRWNFGDNMGLLVLFGLPLALLQQRQRQLALLWCIGMTGWFFTFHWPRFSMVLLPLAIVLVMAVLRRITGVRPAATLLVAVALLHVYFYTTLTYTGSQVFVPSLTKALGAQHELQFLPSSIEVCEQANERLSPDEHRLMFVGETRSYPCAIPFDFWNAHYRHPFERIPHRMVPEQWWDRHIAERSITHVMYSPEVARRRMEWPESLHLRLESWLSKRGRVIAAASKPQSATYLVELHR